MPSRCSSRTVTPLIRSKHRTWSGTSPSLPGAGVVDDDQRSHSCYPENNTFLCMSKLHILVSEFFTLATRKTQQVNTLVSLPLPCARFHASITSQTFLSTQTFSLLLPGMSSHILPILPARYPASVRGHYPLCWRWTRATSPSFENGVVSRV